jgi:hypothetical protein
MRRSTILPAVILLALVACTDDSASTPENGAVDCIEPPQAQLEPESEFDLTVDPNPVPTGSSATLSVDYEQADGSDITGVGATWECWDGESWTQTHVIARAFNESPPAVYDSSGTVAIPDIGLVVPHSHEILIPEVGAGTYRLTDLIYSDGEELTGHVIVEVTG